MDDITRQLWQQFKANDLYSCLQLNSDIFSHETNIVFYSLQLGLICKNDHLMRAKIKTAISQQFFKLSHIYCSVESAKDAIIVCPTYFPAYQQLLEVLKRWKVSQIAPILTSYCFRHCKIDSPGFTADAAAKYLLELLECLRKEEASEEDAVQKLLFQLGTDYVGLGPDWNKVLECLERQESRDTFQLIVITLNRCRARCYLEHRFLICIRDFSAHRAMEAETDLPPIEFSFDPFNDHVVIGNEQAQQQAANIPIKHEPSPNMSVVLPFDQIEIMEVQIPGAYEPKDEKLVNLSAEMEAMKLVEVQGATGTENATDFSTETVNGTHQSTVIAAVGELFYESTGTAMITTGVEIAQPTSFGMPDSVEVVKEAPAVVEYAKVESAIPLKVGVTDSVDVVKEAPAVVDDAKVESAIPLKVGVTDFVDVKKEAPAVVDDAKVESAIPLKVGVTDSVDVVKEAPAVVDDAKVESAIPLKVEVEDSAKFVKAAPAIVQRNVFNPIIGAAGILTKSTAAAAIADEVAMPNSTAVTGSPTSLEPSTQPKLNERKPKLNERKPKLNERKPKLNERKPKLNERKPETSALGPKLSRIADSSKRADAKYESLLQKIEEEIDMLPANVLSRAVHLPQPADLLERAMDPLDEFDIPQLQKELEEAGEGPADLEMGEDINAKEWEVECTSDVWRLLCSMNLPFKRLVCHKVSNLAQCFWNEAIPVTKSDKSLFTTKITRSTYFIWERAIAFSSRLSQIGSSAGIVYTELIRVWAIGMSKEMFQRQVLAIKASKMKGNSSPFSTEIFCQSETSVSQLKPYPKRYGVAVTSEGNLHRETLKLQPPGAFSESEFHIVKFYFWDANFVRSILHPDGMAVDFPFRVTEKEWEIISLDFECPIILIGRSGTGKTTCAVFRLFDAFYHYWIDVKDIESPLLSSNRLFHCTVTTQHEEVDEAVGSEEKPLVHLRQAFIVKNPVLGREVKKCFRSLYNGSRNCLPHLPFCDELPQTLSEMQDVHFPMFVSMRRFLLMLDASLPGEMFFKKSRNNVLLNTDWMGNENRVDNLLDAPCTAFLSGAPGTQRSDALKTEVTYETFCTDFWNGIRHKRIKNQSVTDIHPSLVWTEIISYIKGTQRSLQSGFLTEMEYMEVGIKKAPEFSSTRNLIYEIFKEYKKYCQNEGHYDYCDVVSQLYQRLIGTKYISWTIHELYIDETQDFTEAELFLCLCVTRDPNKAFFTGDTAQSIFRGVSFRFEDLKSLYHIADKQFYKLDPLCSVKIPSQLHYLTQNYRSHSGILSLAYYVLQILSRFFPKSFDSGLPPDSGLFEGPKPCLIKSYSKDELAAVLSGKVGGEGHGHIDFGAHQAIIVANDDARQYLKNNFPQLAAAIVITVYESKGLEFDDVLLFNFFKDSPASAEWRVVKAFLCELIDKPKEAKSNCQFLPLVTSINLNAVTELTRPRDLQPEKDKILTSILKQLYTAITRARVNLWIFDESVENRAPMFEFFEVLDLVNVVSESGNIATLCTTSTSVEWKHRGVNFYLKGLFDQAEHCYRMANETKLEALCKARKNVENAKRSGDCKQFAPVAQQHLQLGLVDDAVDCLGWGTEYKLAAILCQKIGQFGKAHEFFDRAQMYTEAASCKESMGESRAAVDYLKTKYMFCEAIQFLKRQKDSSDHQKIAEDGAQYYLLRSRTELIRILEFIPFAARIRFLVDKNQFELAAEFYAREGQEDEAAELLYREGITTKLLEAARTYARNKESLVSLCCVSIAENFLKDPKTFQPSHSEGEFDAHIECSDRLSEAILFYDSSDLLENSAYCRLLLYRVTGDLTSLEKALVDFRSKSCHIGIVLILQEVMLLLKKDERAFQKGNNHISWVNELVRLMESLFELLVCFEPNLVNINDTGRSELIESCLTFLGLQRSSTGHLSVRKSGYPPILKLQSSIRKDGITYIGAIRIAFDFLSSLFHEMQAWSRVAAMLETEFYEHACCPVVCDALQQHMFQSYGTSTREECLEMARDACKSECRYRRDVYREVDEFQQMVVSAGRLLTLHCHASRYVKRVVHECRFHQKRLSQEHQKLWRVLFGACDRNSMSEVKSIQGNSDQIEGSRNSVTQVQDCSTQEMASRDPTESENTPIQTSESPPIQPDTENNQNKNESPQDQASNNPNEGDTYEKGPSQRQVEARVLENVLFQFVDNVFRIRQIFRLNDSRIFPYVNHFYDDANYLYGRIYGAKTERKMLPESGFLACDMLNAIYAQRKWRIERAEGPRPRINSRFLPERLQHLELRDDRCDFCGDRLFSSKRKSKTNPGRCEFGAIHIQVETTTRIDHEKLQRHFDSLRGILNYTKALVELDAIIKRGRDRLQADREALTNEATMAAQPALVKPVNSELSNVVDRAEDLVKSIEEARDWQVGAQHLLVMADKLNKLIDIPKEVPTMAICVSATLVPTETPTS